METLDARLIGGSHLPPRTQRMDILACRFTISLDRRFRYDESRFSIASQVWNQGPLVLKPKSVQIIQSFQPSWTSCKCWADYFMCVCPRPKL
ncbi:hypothetical protein CEXT_491391 [Caerostris extrusa]|uniref:Uncharacterized protein n=1 Tax=Caerostris extrusa TaxID=172846 RepID=A0AAV4T1Q3_CAEEX|nr:hypothetical protein CEXT_491391 [Caerostris extrusa]